MTSLENSLERIHRLNERHQQQIEALARPAKEISHLAEKLRIPTVKLSPEFITSMKASQAIVDQFAAVKIPTVRLLPEFTASMKVSQAIVDQFAAVKMSAVKLSPEFAASMKATQEIVDKFAAIREQVLRHFDRIAKSRALSKQLTPRAISSLDHRPTHFRNRRLDSISTVALDPLVVPRVSPAQDVLRRVEEQYQRQKKLDEDHRHVVVIVVTLLTGKTLLAQTMSTDGDYLIRIVGENSSKRRREVVIGFASFQYEIITVERPPRRPDLKIV